MITVNGRPFNIFEDSGFKKLLAPFNSLMSTPITAESTRNLVHEKANGIRDAHHLELEKKIICLKADCAKRLGRSVICKYLTVLLK
jgi:hypothetical protein